MIRLSASERAALERKAHALGLSLSEYVRQRALSDDDGRPYLPPRDDDESGWFIG